MTEAFQRRQFSRCKVLGSLVEAVAEAAKDARLFELGSVSRKQQGRDPLPGSGINK
jgi:hypothetical protein